MTLDELQSRHDAPRKASRNGALMLSLAAFVVTGLAVLGIDYFIEARIGVGGILLALLLALIVVSSLHVAMGWERAVVVRLGKVARVAGPGIYFTIPVIEHTALLVDQRIIVTPLRAKETLTADLVPVDIDAVLYWLVWDAEKACVEVEDYYSAVSYLAQTSLREAVGRSEVAEVALRRDQLDAEIKEDIEKEAASWGVDVVAVKVRDIVIPPELQEVMSLEAQAERESNARMTVAAVEADMAEMLSAAARAYGDDAAAMQLRTMLMQYETVKRSGSSVVTMPSAVSDGFVDKAAGQAKGTK